MVETVSKVDWENILKLLMLTMLSDGREYERHAATFVSASINLRANLNVRGFQTRQMTMDWYIRHRKELTEIHTGETFENDLLALIDSLDSIPNKKPLLRTLKNLAKRDSERRPSEMSVVATSKARWA